MKKISVIILSILALAAIATAAPSTHRGHSWKQQRSLTTVEDFQDLKVGDTIAQVCKTCDTVSTSQINSKEQAMAYCEEGTIMECPACKKKTTVTIRGPRTEQTRKIIRYVDDHGDACMFMMKM